MRTTRHRVFLAWLKWLDMDLERPSRADWYAMQTAAEVRRGLVKQPNDVDVNKFIVKFDRRKRLAPQKKMTDEELMRRSKAAWLGAAGIGRKQQQRKGKQR